LAESGCRACEALGDPSPDRRRHDPVRAPAAQGRRRAATAEVPAQQAHDRGAASAQVEQRLAAASECVFDRLNLKAVERAWKDALTRASLADPHPVVHDLRYTHAIGLIADGWDPVEIAARLGDRVETILAVYAHEFDAKRRSARAALDERYGRGDGSAAGWSSCGRPGEDGPRMTPYTPSQPMTHAPEPQ
jgi:hypothetical protein